MKLDLNLLRLILLYIEENADDYNHIYIKEPIIDGYTLNEIIYHVKLLIDGEYIIAEMVGINENKVRVRRLTLKGHEYLENIKNKYIWDEIRKDLELKGFKNVSIEILKEYTNKVIKNKLGL